MSVHELKRVLGLPTVTFIAIGFMIGGGVFVFTGIVLKITGPFLPLAYALAMVPVFISMMPLAMLGSTIPVTGANYRYPSRMVSPGLAFVGVWIYALASFFGQIPLYAITCGHYVKSVLPGISPVLFALILVTFFYVINLLGVKLAAQIQAVLVLILISALVFYIYRGSLAVNMEHFSGIFNKGAGNLILGVALLTFTYFGANGIIELGGEIINPGRVIPRAFFIAFPVVTIMYTGVAFVTAGAVPCQTLEGVKEPLIHVSRFTCGTGGSLFFILGGAVLALTTTLNALFIVGTKSLLMIVEDGILPAGLGKTNRRFGTPHILLTIIWALSLVGILSGLPLEILASYAALGGLIIFLPIQLASLKLPALYPEEYSRSTFVLKGFWRWFCPVTGIAMVIFFSLVLLVDLKTPVRMGFFLLFLVSGILYYWLRKRFLQKRGTDLSDLVKKEETLS
jgi:APA family basic amino acid/polyamine antiporter